MKETYNQKYGTSPIYTFDLGASGLSAGSSKLFDFENDNPETLTYLPFNFVNIVNNSSNRVKVTINQDDRRVYYINSGTIINFDKKTIPAIWYVEIENQGTTTITQDQLTMTVYREGITVDSLVQKAHKFIFARKKRNVI